MPIISDFSALRPGQTPAEALNVFRQYCNHQNTLFVTERWFQPFREKLLAGLPAAISGDHVIALCDALEEHVKLDLVLAWLGQSNHTSWVEFRAQRESEQAAALEAARQERIRNGIFPWSDVDECRAGHELDQNPLQSAPAFLKLRDRAPIETHRDHAIPCPVCGAQFDSLAHVYFVSPSWTWEELCGRAGWLTICDNCHVQVQFFCDIMN